jgi:PAS domain S-box-containing protein
MVAEARNMAQLDRRRRNLDGGRLFRYLPYIVAAAYAVFSAAWIAFSDRFVASIATSASHLNQMQTYKGQAFIILSALMILFMLRYAWQRLFAAYDATRASERRLELALSSAGGGVWEVAIGGDESEVFLSQDMLRKLGFPDDYRMTVAELSRLRHPEDIPASDQAFARVIAGESPFLDTRYRMRSTNGSYRWIQTRGMLVHDDTGSPQRLIGVSLDITDQVQAEERVSELLRFDPFTGLAKTQRFLADIGEALDDTPQGALGVAQVRLLNIERYVREFETADDAGIVQEMAERLQNLADNRIHAARISTDTFAVATPVLQTEHAVHRLIQEVIDLMSAPLPQHQGGTGPRLAAGGAVYPRDGDDAAVLLRNAGHALDKMARGDTGISWFTEGLDVAFRARNERLRQLAAAPQNGEIECYFQPLVDLTGGRTAGFEALARWRSPKEGLVAPDEFIPLAEEFGHIGAIGESVLRQACRAAARWTAQDGNPPFVAVNVSPLQIADPGFPTLVARVLAETALEPRRLELEVTESAVTREPEAAARRLSELKALGVSVAIDDFGTGYSSLSLLTRLPFSRLKIDRGFIAGYGENPETTTIADTIIDLAHRLRLKITAEGVENDFVAGLLARRGVDMAQGYGFSRPLPESEAAVLADKRWAAATAPNAGAAVPGSSHFGG